MVAAVTDYETQDYKEIFFGSVEEDSLYLEFRAENGIRKLGESDSIIPVRDSSVCEEWLPTIATTLSGLGGQTQGNVFLMIQYGPYMIVSTRIDPANPNQPKGSYRMHLLVFEVVAKRFVASLLE